MSTCIHCGRDTGDMKHRLVDIRFGNETIIKEMFENRSEKWKCLAEDKDYCGGLSEKATLEAKNDYNNRRKLFFENLFIELDPENAQMLKSRGMSNLNLGNYNQAIVDFSQALNFSPNDGEIDYLRGEAYAKLGKLDLANRDQDTAARKGYNPSKEKE